MAAFLLGNFNDSVSVKVGGDRSQVKGKGRAQRVLRLAVRISVECRYADSVLSSGPSNTSVTGNAKLVPTNHQDWQTHSAISPLFAIRIESNDFWDFGVVEDTVEAALLNLRATGGPRRDEVRRRDESGMVINVMIRDAAGQCHKNKSTPQAERVHKITRIFESAGHQVLGNTTSKCDRSRASCTVCSTPLEPTQSAAAGKPGT